MNCRSALILGLAVVLVGCSASSSPGPRAVGGSLDLSTYSWSRGPVALDGQWTFEGRPIEVPSNLSFQGQPYGEGTYHLTVQLPPGDTPLALGLPIIGTAFELRINGQGVAKEGVVSPTPQGAVPSYRPRVVLVPPGTGPLDLQIRVSNWDDQFAGLGFPLTLGPWDQVQGLQSRATAWEALLFGAIFLMGLYHCGSFVFRTQNRAPLWFGVFCLLIAIRSTFYSQVLFLTAFPEASWYVVIRGVYVTMSLGWVAFALFLHRLYPSLTWRPALRTALAVGLGYAAINLIAPIPWTTTLLVPVQVTMLAYGIYALVSVARALRTKESGAGLFVAGVAVFLVTVALDIVKSHWVNGIPSLVNLGTLAFLIFQSFVVARLYAASFALAESHSRAMDRINASLERFIPREVLSFLNKKSITEIDLGDFSEMRMTVFFLDIRDFTSLSESMSPQENFRFINSFLRRFGPLVRDHSGFVDKYLGDGMMALFPGKPDTAVRAAVAMRKTLKDYNEGRLRGGYPAIRFGIGIHTGPLMLGTIGENRRMDSTVISDTVNAASRLEGLTKKYATDILVSGDTVEGLDDPQAFSTTFVALETVKGKVHPIQVFQVDLAEIDTGPPHGVLSGNR